MPIIVTLRTSRTDYDIRDAAEGSMTIADLISELRRYDEDQKVVFSNDGGYTYGTIGWRNIAELCVESKEEEEERERKEREEEEYWETLEGLDTDLCSLHIEYENDENMTDEEFQAERQGLFKDYGVTEEEYLKWCEENRK